MEVKVKARKFGGSIGIIIPREVIEKERINVDDDLEINIEKKADLNFMWGICKDVKIPTDQIMKEIDEGEFYDE